MGKAAALRFAKGGFAVALLNRTDESAKPAEDAINAAGGQCLYVKCDATQKDSLEQAFQEVKSKLGSVEVLVYNASAGYKAGGVLQVDPSVVENCWRVNCLGCLIAIQQVLPDMLQRGRGTILCSSATAAFRGSKNGPSFPIAKFGLRALTQSVAKEYSSKGIHCVHIRLDCILDTPKAKSFMGDNYNPELCGNVDAIAETYWHLYTQDRRAWTNEIDIRPYTEDWTF